ncbi:beta-1,3-galactosyltransferase 1-like [Mercenaria mercenaria]|uniref:beta-1,3-galactosyltransferase 1-like n=1 Tax=Mercenaria mercenaria TaxID=6596 RepID=UPI00234F2078|nr:beta-1,3-galactosyltransferase 1-like [Mercenaria mercenaria]
MSRKLVCFLWCIIIVTAFYVMVTIMTNFSEARGKMIYMNGLDAFYRDVGMRGFDRQLLFRQGLGVQNAFGEIVADQPPDKDIQYLFVNEGSNLLPEVKKSVETEGSAANNKSGNSTEKRQSSLEKLVAEKRMKEQYYKLRSFRINPFEFKFIETGENICEKDEEPFLVILCLTQFYDIETREAIRETWGSVARTRQWPSFRFKIPTVKLVFLFGDHENSLVKKTIITDEKLRFGDIAVADFKDTYSNLTLKVMMGLKWVSKYCPKAKFVTKIDQDTFLHVVNLIKYLSFLPIPAQGAMIGFQNSESKVLRTGRWRVERTRFPMHNYPNYTNGNCYVISGNAVGSLFEAAERMPYITVEDAFITGIVRTTLGLKLIDNKGFTRWNEKPPRLCGFHNDIRIAATNTDDDRKRKLWKALGYRNLRNCYDVTKHADT